MDQTRPRLIADTPAWALYWLCRAALRHQLQRQILGYSGISLMRFTHFAPVEHRTDAIRARWLATVTALGRLGSQH